MLAIIFYLTRDDKLNPFGTKAQLKPNENSSSSSPQS